MRVWFAALLHARVRAQDEREEPDVYVEELGNIAAPCVTASVSSKSGLGQIFVKFKSNPNLTHQGSLGLQV